MFLSSPQVYVHRSGRTARIQNEGLSLLLISPDDLRSYERIWKSLKKGQHFMCFLVMKGRKTSDLST
jgi:ATP-dependent RNA helicase DDX24/MAK5